MMTSSRPRGDVGGSFASRRGHSNQLSISDPSHHVTEAIGTLYGDEDDDGSESGRPMSINRPLSFIGGPTPYQESLPRPPPDGRFLSVDTRRALKRTDSEGSANETSPINGDSPKRPHQLSPNQRSNSYEQGPKSPLSPTLSLRDVQADSQFSLTNIGNPNDIAQELSNLQALRRLSMDVGNNKDPDMPPMSLMAMPTIAPSGDDDENDPSRLLWVPARVHPELAPGEFKSFLENRVQSIRRRSGDSFLSADTDISEGDSGIGGLRRKKSMLSRQIDNSGDRGSVDYIDGADRLERKRSRGHSHELSLEELVKDPTKAVQKFAQESQIAPSGPESSADDMPILPAAPGMGLRRSTRTTYRKGGSLRTGPLARRSGHRQQPSEDMTFAPLEAPPGHGLSRVQSEPVADNYSRQNQAKRSEKLSQESLDHYDHYDGASQEFNGNEANTADTFQDQLPIRSSPSLPAIQTSSHQDMQDQNQQKFPKRSSSQNAKSQPVSHRISEPEPPIEEEPSRGSRKSFSSRQNAQQAAPQQQTSRSSYPQSQSLSDNLAANPSLIPGSGSTRTDSLTIIPTFTQEERKSDKKSKKDRDDDASSSKGSAWKWFKSTSDEKEKKKEKEESKRSKTKSLGERGQDNARLDVIQTSIDKNAPKGRESLVLDRDNVESRLQEERKKESHRKSDSKRDKDGSIFSSIFGGSKKKEEKERSSKKTQHLKVPEEPVYKPLVPDVDYHWTRFPLLEERAIYRMAHIKLANPRRPLHSQVLLSNFMYSYLAIVQAMHPQMNVPISPQQKRLEEEARRKQQEQEYLAQQRLQEEQEAQEAMDQYDFDYHRAAVQYGESGSGEVDYVDDAQIYEDEHGNDHHEDYSYDDPEGYGPGAKEYYHQYHDTGNDRRNDGREDMW
ncbi:hypothetical protein FIE12Z_7232 [Fusarium flagelliforme]|uniref:Protein Zds1 C-terminal domain-containing protein n=2 Tax=Fusarium flagelliforme TaxID=2675880 RepID=A0A395MKT0_9HYPO|nr:hypothetical protein FIE12Z_7232 [Fusarium flagelliforme]